ncbi:hypothetical protein MKK69_04085 [Methylobacterium sp. J-026]|uniref:hypothetical protein n=1 Tax=Methylobacterium sp. J-026 TaxID=2836624 RepID=UPI001FB9A853|nr:hypothetical protein [Methylobacterium sp. J-026]MCJ2133252.1 hypothetical protein [Methylobacterium sp. J-026]
MNKMKLTLAASVLLGGFAFAGSASATPMTPSGMQTDQSGITQVRMMHGDRMMMKKRMMHKRMMRRHMMKKRMMHRM